MKTPKPKRNYKATDLTRINLDTQNARCEGAFKLLEITEDWNYDKHVSI